jgi:hypothetical protein
MKITDDEKDPEKKWFTIDIRELGIKPIKVNEGDKIHVLTRVGNDEQRRCFYGYSGSQSRYSEIPNQEYDFDTDYSDMNDNSTSNDWG